MADYPTFVADIENLMAMDPTDVDFNEIIPAMITYAEMRIYRELDLISTVTRDTSVVCSVGTSSTTAPTPFVVVSGINILTPIGAAISTSARTPLAPVSKEVLYSIWGDPTAPGMPVMYAMIDQWNMILGPTPDNIYTLEIYGTQRPAPLSATNTTTFLTLYLYDLFLAAGMVFASGYMRNFSSSGNDPQMPVNWEQQYQTLKGSANVEELRKKSQADAWSTYPPTPAQPSRG